MADRVSFGDGTFVKSAVFSADGNVLAVLYNPTSARSDDPKNACVLWDVSAATQEVIASVPGMWDAVFLCGGSNLIALVPTAGATGDGDVPDQGMSETAVHFFDASTAADGPLAVVTVDEPVLHVAMNPDRAVVTTASAVAVFDLSDGRFSEIGTIATGPNPGGLCALSPGGAETGLVAYPGCQTGEAVVVDTVTMEVVSVVRVEDEQVAWLGFAPDARHLMSVPVSGKFVHVHDLFPDGGVESGAAQVAELDTCRAVDVAPSVDDTATLVVTASPDGKASVFHWDAELERHYIGKHAVNYWRGANMKMIEICPGEESFAAVARPDGEASGGGSVVALTGNGNLHRRSIKKTKGASSHATRGVHLDPSAARL